MPTQNSNPQAVAFFYNKILPLANQMKALYMACEDIQAEWQQQGVFNVIPNDQNILGNPSNPVTDYQALQIISRAGDIVNWMQGSAAITANDGSKTILNTVEAVTQP